MEPKTKKVCLYDTRDTGEPCLTKFYPVQPLKYYRTQSEIYRSFKQAQKAVLVRLGAQLVELQAEYDDTLRLTPETCPLGTDPYG